MVKRTSSKVACPAWDRQRARLPEARWRTASLAHAGGVAAGSRGSSESASDTPGSRGEHERIPEAWQFW
jgi:hypothetical protein